MKRTSSNTQLYGIRMDRSIIVIRIIIQTIYIHIYFEVSFEYDSPITT